jgi:Ca2+-binding RTX toxin-like protein
MADNAILLENQKQGTARSVWDAPATNRIEGFATDISVDHGDTVSFKINVNAAVGQQVPYRIEIYRLGYYGGDGATLVTTINASGTAQPEPLKDARGLVDAGNWSVSASWDTPASAVSGVYLAKLVRLDSGGGTNQIPFIIRDDNSTSDIVLQTSDTTWQAYNGWGGNNAKVAGNFYGGFDQPDNLTSDPGPNQDRAFAVSYNRPIITRDGGGAASGAQDYLFGADYAAISWLEKNGYSVSYMSGVDTDRLGASYLTNHKAFISVGHDEYWAGAQRANVEAARDAGVNLLFWSGNEVYWKTRWESSIAAGGQDHRTLVSYKETWANATPTAGPQDYANIDPSNEWTGTWRDLRFVDAVNAAGTRIATGARPENSLTGQLFGPDDTGRGTSIDIPQEFAALRVWRDTGVPATGQFDLAPGLLGYEWDTTPEDAYRPAGLIKLSETTVNWGSILVDQGNRTAPGIATHNLSLYRADSGALVFGAGTVFWSWGLSNEHDGSPYDATIANRTIQQFTVNLFADMGIQPGVANAVLASQGLVRASASTDITPARITLSNLPDAVSARQTITIAGTATDNDGNAATTDGRVAVVEVSLDGGTTWRVAEGTTNWSFDWRPTAQGTYTIVARAIDDSLNIRSVPTAQDIVQVTAPTPPSVFTLFDNAAPTNAALSSDNQAVELGMKFTVSRPGEITELKYYRASGDAGDTDTRSGHLWGPDGSLLASATFTSAPGVTGWQVATLTAPITLQAGSQYTVSYKTANNYLATSDFFNPSREVTFDGLDNDAFSEPFGVISAPQSSVTGNTGGVGGNGVYAYGAALTYPNNTFGASNYWVDVTFRPLDASANRPPAFTSPTAYTIPENQAQVATVAAQDPDGNSLTYGIVGGADANLFQINASTGVLRFKVAPDFEVPADAGANNVYNVTVSASDGFASVTQALAISVSDVVETTPTGVGLFAATDVPSRFVSGSSDPTNYELGTRFTANATGTVEALRYYRGAADADDTDARTLTLWNAQTGANIGSASVTSAPGDTGWQVANLATPVSLQSGASYIVSYSYAFNNGSGAVESYAATASYFTAAKQSAGGYLTAPASGASAGNGVFAAGAPGSFPASTFNATNYWTDVIFRPGQDAPPSFTSASTVTANENQILATTLRATDPDGGTLQYSIAGGVDAAKFQVNSTTGVVTFRASPDFETSGDANGDNIYELTAGVSDGTTTVTQSLRVTLTNLADAVTASTLFGQGGVPAQIVTADAGDYELGLRFQATQSGVVSALRYFRGAEDAFDTDTRTLNLWDASGSKIASVTVTSPQYASGWQVATLATPVALTANTTYVVSYGTTQNYAYTPTAFATDITGSGGVLRAPAAGGNGVVAEGTPNSFPTATTGANYWADLVFAPGSGPVFTSPATFASAENQTAVGTVAAVNAQPVNYAIVGGADAALFQINAATGALSFRTAPNFEAPGDADRNGTYLLTVSASDEVTGTVQQNLVVTVQDLNEFAVTAPQDTNTATNTVPENSPVGTLVGVTALATDADGSLNTVSYSLTDNAGGRFTINPTTGVVSVAMGAVIDFETATQHGITVRASSADGSSASTSFTISVQDLVDSGVSRTGTAGADSLLGTSGNDTLTGLDGNDTLDGSTGADSLVGSTGNDVYIVDNASDVVTEASGAGTDTVRTTLLAYTLGANLEALVFTGAGNFSGTGNTLANSITGGAGNDTLNGGSGADTLDGGIGADTLVGGAGNDTYLVDDAGDGVTEAASAGTDTVRTGLLAYALGLNLENLVFTGLGNFSGTGNALANSITGGAGNDTLDGDVGADTLVGGAGNDTFIVGSTGEVITETAGAGTDTVQTILSAYTLGTNLETLTFVGSGNFAGTGNALANSLTGGAGNDTLNGGTGADTLIGGAGNDLYTIDNAGDVVTELQDQGVDTIQASLTFTLGANIENLVLTGTGAISGTGNGLDNSLTGNAGANRLTGGVGADTLIGNGGADTLDGGTENDRLTGGAGADSLTGGGGADIFIYNTTSEGGDTITDFTSGVDSIWLSAAGFAGLAPGALASSNLTIGAAASGTAAQIIYNPTLGRLSWDADGSGAGTAIVLAALSNTPAILNTSDFLVVA